MPLGSRSMLSVFLLWCTSEGNQGCIQNAGEQYLIYPVIQFYPNEKSIAKIKYIFGFSYWTGRPSLN